MSRPTREEVQAFIEALRDGRKVSHAPAFLIALAEGWLENNSTQLNRKKHNERAISENFI